MNRLVTLVAVGVIAVNTAQAFFTVSGPSPSDINRWAELTRQENEAAKSGNWELALSYHNQAMQTEMGAGNSAAQKAANCLTSFFYLWNLGEYERAHTHLQQCVNTLKSSHYGNNCEDRAVVFLKRIDEGKVPKSIKFTCMDIGAKNGICNYIMEVPWAMEFKKWNDLKRKYDMMNRILDSQLQTARLESQRIESTIKIQVRQDYLEKHNEMFDPNNRPSYDSPKRNDWDACKRIYDIFD